VTLGNTVMKADASKIRKLRDGNVLCGFAGPRRMRLPCWSGFEAKAEGQSGQCAAGGDRKLAKEWRMDRAMRRLESVMIVADAKHSLLVSGTGDVIQPRTEF